MKICIAGKNNIAIEICKLAMQYFDKDDIYVVTNSTDNGIDGFQRSFLKYAYNEQLNIVNLEFVYSFSNMIFLSLEFDKLINPSRFKSTNLYNIHFSLLPSYKGMYTSYWPIINNETSTGVTLHKIDHGIDTGEIISQIEIPITSNMNAKQLYQEYIRAGIILIRDNFDNIINGNIVSKIQSAKGSTYHSKASVNYKNIIIDMKQTAHTIKNQIRALNFRDFQLPKVENIPISHCVIDKIKSTKKAGTLIRENKWCFYYATIDYNIYLYKDKLLEICNCCYEGNVELLKYFIMCEYNMNEQDREGNTPLIMACKKGQIEIVKLLIANGVEISLEDYMGNKPLDHAFNFGKSTNSYECYDLIQNNI